MWRRKTIVLSGILTGTLLLGGAAWAARSGSVATGYSFPTSTEMLNWMGQTFGPTMAQRMWSYCDNFFSTNHSTSTNTAPAKSSASSTGDASIGETLWTAKQCNSCHGANGGGPTPTWAQMAQAYPTADALSTFIQENMPLTAPGTLSASQAAALTAYIEQQTGLASGTTKQGNPGSAPDVGSTMPPSRGWGPGWMMRQWGGR